MRHLKIFISCALLTSCAIVAKKYIEPERGSIATINFVNSGVGPGGVEFFRGYETCKGREFSELILAGENREFRVRAGSPISFSFGYNVNGKFASLGYTYCRVYGTFSPAINERYRAEISRNQMVAL